MSKSTILIQHELAAKQAANYLASYNILLHTNEVHTSRRPDRSLPIHVDRVRRRLLNFENVVHAGWTEHFEGEYKSYIEEMKQAKSDDERLMHECLYPPENAFDPEVGKTPQSSKDRARCQGIDDTLRDCEEMAGQLAAINDLESVVEHIYQDFFFHKPVPMTIRGHGIHRAEWTVYSKANWTEDFPVDQVWRSCGVSMEKRQWCVPDLTYGFNMIRSRADVPVGHGGQMQTQLLSAKCLASLRRSPLAIPSSIQWKIHNCRTERDLLKLKNHNFICFPYCVVEFKDEADLPSTRESYQQAAFGATRALSLYYDLYYKTYVSRGQAIHHPIPPTIAITVCLTTVKLWMVYHDQARDRGVEMRCIWSISTRLTWGVFSLGLILDNIEEWATKQLKIELIAALDQARSIARELKISVREHGEPNDGESEAYTEECRASGIELETIDGHTYAVRKESNLESASALLGLNVTGQAARNTRRVHYRANESRPRHSDGSTMPAGTDYPNTALTNNEHEPPGPTHMATSAALETYPSSSKSLPKGTGSTSLANAQHDSNTGVMSLTAPVNASHAKERLCNRSASPVATQTLPFRRLPGTTSGHGNDRKEDGLRSSDTVVVCEDTDSADEAPTQKLAFCSRTCVGTNSTREQERCGNTVRRRPLSFQDPASDPHSYCWRHKFQAELHRQTVASQASGRDVRS